MGQAVLQNEPTFKILSNDIQELLNAIEDPVHCIHTMDKFCTVYYFYTLYFGFVFVNFWVFSNTMLHQLLKNNQIKI